MYEKNLSSGTISTGTWTTAPVEIMATPNVVPALQGLAEASHLLAKAAESFIYARNELSNAQSRYNEALNAVAKEREQAGV